MQRICLKCSHTNKASSGDEREPCPQCGAIYSKVEKTIAGQQATRLTAETASAAPHKKSASFAARYEAMEQRTTQRTGIGMGAWMLVLLVVVPVAWLFATQEQNQRADPGLQYAQALQTIATAQHNAIQQAISEKRVLVGMTAAQAQAAWGSPTSINRTVTAGSTHEQWVYRRGKVMTNYVYLDDGVVRSFQVSE